MADDKQTKMLYVRRGGKVKGPLAADVVRGYFEAQQLKPDDEVSADGKQWRRLGDIPAFTARKREPVADPQEQAALQWEFERRKAQQRAEQRERVRREESAPRVRPWHYLLVVILVGAVGSLPFVIPSGEGVSEPQCDAPPAPGVVWRDCRLPGQQAANADLSAAILRGANLTGAVLRAANLTGADASYANLSYASLRAANLSQAQLIGANLRDSDLSHANLQQADLSYADLRGADLRYADLPGARLDNAIWSEGVVCLPGSEGECIPGRRTP